MDSSPDRWGRTLMDRREAILARKEDRKPKKLVEEDYLLGVYDAHRMGALRFKVAGNDDFQHPDTGLTAPPWTSLKELQHASLALENDLLKDKQALQWINLLIAPGASLGGARPKASVLDQQGDLWIAKFPSAKDTQDIGAWEMVAREWYFFTELARSLEVSHPTVRSYLDILTDFYMVRQVQPWSGNTRKRLVKSPKIYLRDTGLLHKLLNISDFESLLGHPILGASWEGFVVKNIVRQLSGKWQYSYYRSVSQTEIDLVLEGPRKQIWAIEIKRSSAPVVGKGFHTACEDINATHKFVLYGGKERFPMSGQLEAIGLIEFLRRLNENN